MTPDYQPTRDLLLVKQESDPSPIFPMWADPLTQRYAPMKYRDYIRRARVLAVGPGTFYGKTFVKTTVEAGDIVLIGPRSGEEVNIDGEEFLVLKEGEIVGVVEE